MRLQCAPRSTPKRAHLGGRRLPRRRLDFVERLLQAAAQPAAASAALAGGGGAGVCGGI